MTARYTLLSREGCELCEEFAQAAREHFGPAVTISVQDVDARADWQRRYGLRIPVLLDEWNEVIAETHFDPATLP